MPRSEYNPCRQNGTTPRHVIPRERKQVEESSQAASFALYWFIFQRGGFLHSADAAVGMTKGGTFLRIRLLFLQHFTLPRGPHQARPGEPASPEGSFCTVLLGGIIQLYGLYTLRFMAMNHRRYIAWFHSTAQVIFGT